LRRFLAVALLAMGLSSCAKIEQTTLNMDSMSRFAEGRSAIIVINTSGALFCDTTFIALHREGAEKNDVFITYRQAGYGTSAPAAMVVEPGRYRLAGASCLKAGYYPASMSTAALWFGDIEVKAGEVVYMGTLDTELLDYKTQMSSGMKALNALFFTGRDANEFKYIAYRFNDSSADVIERLRVDRPELVDLMKTRLPPVYITRDDFAGALQRAYAPNADGTLPTTDQAQARLPQELKTVVEAAIAARRAAHGQPPAAKPDGAAPSHI
jgi:hypothetical protein